MIEFLKEIPLPFYAVYIGIIGAAVGSFLNVVIYRLPREISIVKPASHCPSCKNPIKPWHNIPILSWFLLRGKCAYCGAKFSFRYPAIEALASATALWSLFRFGISWEAFGGMLLSWHLIAISMTDFDEGIIPDHIVLPMALGGILTAWLTGGLPGLLDAGISIAVTTAFLVVFYWVTSKIMKKQSMGMGDITMIAGFSLYLNPLLVAIAIFIGSAASLIVVVTISIIKRESLRERSLRYGPGLAFGAWISYLYGFKLLQSYLELVLGV
ncbi:prepilin peptidase [bacterium]|nr:prepilin peptidase [bacterium]